MSGAQLRVYVPPHPFIKHWLAIVREESTPMPLFRNALSELGRWLTYEALRDFMPTRAVRVRTPLAETDAEIFDIDASLAIIPILRAGLALVESCQSLIPAARIYHLGYRRDEETLEAHCYLDRLPQSFTPETRILITEPMLATGGTLISVLETLESRGANLEYVRVISAIAAAPALQKIGDRYGAIDIYTATIDEHLNEQGFIVPGLGDAGDRAFGTE
ncbi:MAG: uracil phosphoribosyltransferase [Cyanobacteria bacterium J06648_11]